MHENSNADTEGVPAKDSESERVYETIFREMEDAVFLIDVEQTENDYTFTFRQNNASHRQRTGLSEDQLRGQTPRELLGEEQGADVEANYRRCVEQQETIEYEETLNLPGGTSHWHTKLTPITDTGQVTQIVGVGRDITERKEREQKIERQATLLEYSSDVILLLNENGVVEYQTDQNPRTEWQDQPDLEGKQPEDYVHPDDVARVQEAFANVLENPGRTDVTEFRIQTTDGDWRWVENRAQNFLDDPDIDGILVSSRDITNRKESERRIKELKERLELAIEGAELGVWDWDMTTDEVEFNEQWAQMLGYSFDEIEPHLDAWEKRVHPDDVDDVEAALDAHIAGETAYYDTEHRMRTAADNWKWIRDVGKIFEQADDGEPVRAVGIHIDIDKRKQHERKLRQFRQAVENTGHVVYITDTDGTIEYVNPAFEEITGFSESEAVGQDPSILQSGEYGDEYYEELWETILSGETWGDEMFDQRLNGDELVLNQTISPVTDTDGQPEKFIAVGHDITQRKEYEQTLEDQRDNLEILNQVVRHDIRNELQLVLVYAETVESYVQEEGEEYVEQVLEAAQDAVEITKTARDVTEVMLQSGADRHPVRLRPVLANEIDDIRTNYEHAVVRIEGTIPAVNVRADEMLEAVFRNLLTNAIQHNDKDVPEVTVSTTKNEGTVLVRITDNGPGIPDERKEMIFEQGEMGLDSSGTGMGLYLVNTLVNRYGGDIHVEDNDPEGVAFLVTLPVVDDTVADKTLS
jgi:PAS domain S-box-containing protein